MKNVTESLAGRVAILNLQGLSQSEKLQKISDEPFNTEIKKQPPNINATKYINLF
ncbi:MAG: hypothetical protein LBI26_02710 [Holosporales bacterium]|jgi:hypothetical protein|nr:hypothetical protein [Holosporales bacterium]